VGPQLSIDSVNGLWWATTGQSWSSSQEANSVIVTGLGHFLNITASAKGHKLVQPGGKCPKPVMIQYVIAGSHAVAVFSLRRGGCIM